MKPYKYIIAFAVLVTAAFAQEAKPSTEIKLREVAEVSQSTELAKTGNEALRFMLERAKDYTGKAEHALGKAVDITTKEAPETVRQFLVWRAWKHGLMFAFPFCAMMLSLGTLSWCVLKSQTFSRNYIMDRFEVGTYVTIVTSVVSLGVTAANLCNLFLLIQILTAPRIYLIEQLASMLK